MARSGRHSRRRRRLLGRGHEGAGAGKPLTVALLLADEATAEALETDLLRYGVDLLDLYRGFLSYRRVCALVAHLPDDAAVWRVHDPHGAMTRAELVLATVERRITALWATVTVALGQDVTDAQLTGPLDTWTPPTRATRTPASSTPAHDGAELKSLREIALWMRD
ncbi:hypothetical protein ABT256_14405 [Amycolatopsis japonica]|uniref:hypothetical protein n=1 Tax=Amycolatopsis japonica TaxID=208439 RepID=UPI003318A473